jgi:xanthine permease XanP
MAMQTDHDTKNIRFSAEENPPTALAAGLGLQVVILIIAGIILTPAIVMRGAGQGESMTQWAVFAGLVVCGITTMLQARPIGRFGAGYTLFMGTSGAFIAISIDAVKAGGVPLLASLVIASALIQFLFSHYLGQLRKIITPTIGGTIIMLIAVTVFPIAFDLINQHPGGDTVPVSAGPAIAITTFLFIMAISLFGAGKYKLWGPLMGVIIGSLVAIYYGAMDFSKVNEAPWIGLPSASWPGFDLNFQMDFWMLLLPFTLVTIVGAIETYGDGVAIQRLSHRENRAINFKAVQGAVNADGVGNLLSGVMGTLPNTTYSTSLSVVDLTGVASRKVGVFGGAFLLLIAFCPKIAALLLAIPGPVAGAYITVLLILLFLHGLKLIAEDGLTFDNGLIVCTAFWLATGFQNQLIFHDYLPTWATGLLDNGMTAGGLLAIVMMMALKLKDKPKRRLEMPATIAAVPEVQALALNKAQELGWDKSATMRLELAAEEALTFLFDGKTRRDGKKIGVSVHGENDAIILEFVSGPTLSNFDNMLQNSSGQEPTEQSVGLRLLSGICDSCKHMQFNNIDVLTLTLRSKPL